MFTVPDAMTYQSISFSCYLLVKKRLYIDAQYQVRQEMEYEMGKDWIWSLTG